MGDNNPYYLGVTFFVSMLHSLFELLAVKNGNSLALYDIFKLKNHNYLELILNVEFISLWNKKGIKKYLGNY